MHKSEIPNQVRDDQPVRSGNTIIIGKVANQLSSLDTNQQITATRNRSFTLKLLSAFLLFTSLALPTITIASPLPEFPFITITAESTREVKPNKAYLAFEVMVFNENSETGHTQLNKAVTEVLNILKTHQVRYSDVTSFEIDKSTKRQRGKMHNDLEIIGYDFKQRFNVTLNNLERYQAVYSDLLQLDNVHNINASFDTTKRLKVESDLIAETGHKAKNKAQQMAASLGIKLGNVFAINDTGTYSNFFATFGLDETNTSVIRSREGFTFSDTSGGHSDSLFIPKSITISKKLNILYKIEN